MNQKTKARITARNEVLLAKARGTIQTALPPKPSVQLANVRCIVDSLKAGEKTFTTKEISERHGLSLSTIYREFKGKLGCFKWRSKWVVTETAYSQWITDSVLRCAS